MNRKLLLSDYRDTKIQWQRRVSNFASNILGDAIDQLDIEDHSEIKLKMECPAHWKYASKLSKL